MNMSTVASTIVDQNDDWENETIGVKSSEVKQQDESQRSFFGILTTLGDSEQGVISSATPRLDVRDWSSDVLELTDEQRQGTCNYLLHKMNQFYITRHLMSSNRSLDALMEVLFPNNSGHQYEVYQAWQYVLFKAVKVIVEALISDNVTLNNSSCVGLGNKLTMLEQNPISALDMECITVDLATSVRLMSHKLESPGAIAFGLLQGSSGNTGKAEAFARIGQVYSVTYGEEDLGAFWGAVNKQCKWPLFYIVIIF